MLLLLLLLISSNLVLNHALIAPLPSSYSSAAAAVRGRALITTLRFPLQGNYYKHPHQHLVNHNDRLSRRVLMVRGGGDSNIDDTTDNEDDYINTDSDDDATEDGEEYTNNDTSDDEDESAITSDNNKIDEPQSQQQQDIEERRYQLSSQLSSQSRNFGIATALWGSLFFDSILNTAKRTLLFPITTTQSATTTTAAAAALNAISSSSSSLRATIIPTTLLASGFGLASIISFLLWRDLETRADMLSSDDGRSSSKGDDFLSLSTTTTTSLSSAATIETDNNEADDVGLFASQTRTTLYAHLSIFGILSLASHTGYYFSKQAPFLGMSAAIINIHNTLAYVSALLKEKNVEVGGGGVGLVGGLLKLLVMWPIKLFQSKEQDVVNEDEDGSGNKNKLELSSFIYRLGTIVAYMQCIPICKYLYTTIRLLLMPSSSTGGVVVQQELLLLPNVARAICLKIASVARLSLVAGALHSLYTANKSKVYRHHPFFTVLGGMFGVGCLSVTGAILFDTLTGSTSSLTVLSSVAVRNGLTVMLFGLFAVYNSVKGIIASLPQSTTGVET